MVQQLENHKRGAPDSGFDIRAPSATRPKHDLGSYPLNTRFLTPNILKSRDANTTVGFRTNGRISTTILSRSRDQHTVNVNQLLFLDFGHQLKGSPNDQILSQLKIDRGDSPRILNLQQVNYYLALQAPQLFEEAFKPHRLQHDNTKKAFKNMVFHNNVLLNRHDVEKAWILQKFKLHGIVENKDPQMPGYIESIARAITCTVRGMTDVYDYWSTSKRRLSPYDRCFFVLKKVKVTTDMRFQFSLDATEHKSGSSIAPRFNNSYQWQIVPHHVTGNTIPMSEYSWIEDDGYEYFGHYWEIGNVHEYPDIGHDSLFRNRTDLSVCQDITYMHKNGGIKPFQFYLKFDESSKML